MTDPYMAREGRRLIESGYQIVEIAPGGKAPKRKNWSNLPLAVEDIPKYQNWGVGVLAAYTPGLDVDVGDQKQVKSLFEWLSLIYPLEFPRMGRSPRLLFPFRTESPFKKRLIKWVDLTGAEQTVEFLGQGQQWVAYHEHPQTKKPYRWLRGDLPARSELPEIDEAKADDILSLISQWVEDQGFALGRLKSESKADLSAMPSGNGPLQGWSEEDMRMALSYIDADEYETWVQVGMALWHQSEGESWGYDLWVEYSEKSEKFEDEGGMPVRWNSFSHQVAASPITFRTIVKWSEESRRELENSEKDSLLKRVETCLHIDDLRGDIRTDIMLSAINDPIWFDTICHAWRMKFFELSNVKVSMQKVRKELHISAETKGSPVDIPDWLEGWHYVIDVERFVQAGYQNHMTKSGFSDRFMQKASAIAGVNGLGKPQIAAADLALNTFGIPQVAGERYRPGYPPTFKYEKQEYLNTWNPESTPEVTRERFDEVSAILDDHFEMLFHYEKERDWVRRWMAQIVQSPRDRNNTAILLRGPQGVGKNTLVKFLEVAIGEINATSLTPETLGYQFTDWAHGYQLVTVEEVKIHGENRHQVVNRMKTYITEDRIEIHPKGRPAFKTINTSNYFMLTNYRDALPVSAGDRRMFVCETKLKDELQVREFMKEKPDHFPDLYRVLKECPGEIREYFLTVDMAKFRHTGAAPISGAKRQLALATENPLVTCVKDAIQDGDHWLVRPEFVFFSALKTLVTAPDSNFDGRISNKYLAHVLYDMGYRVLERRRIHGIGVWEGERQRIWLRAGVLGDGDMPDIEIFKKVQAQLQDEYKLGMNHTRVYDLI